MISATCQCPSVPYVSALYQCHINATYQCPSELPFSVPRISASSVRRYQCASVPPISAAYQCPSVM
ncbi:unnamed protein product, partial [Staurois parvus]